MTEQAVITKRRIVGAARTEMSATLKKKYEKGASIRALAAATCRSYGFVHRILAESGVVMRPRGGGRPKAR